MGFRMERTVYDLPFDDTTLAGLTITVRAMTMGERLRTWSDLSPTAEDDTETRNAKHDQKFDMFIDHVVSWNIEDADGEAVPVTRDGLYTVAEPEQIGLIIGMWASGRTTVPAPLEQPSSDTSLSEIPMTVLESTPEPV